MTETVTISETGGKKGKKPEQIHWIDPKALLEVARQAGYGAEKYGEGDNYRKGYAWSLSYDAAQRHLMKFWDGEDIDPETGTYHLAAASWHCLALLSHLIREAGTDDRYRQPEPVGRWRVGDTVSGDQYAELPIGTRVQDSAGMLVRQADGRYLATGGQLGGEHYEADHLHRPRIITYVPGR